MTDTQILTCAIAIIFPISAWMIQNARFSDLKDTLQAKLETILERMDKQAGVLEQKMDKQAGVLEQKMGILEQKMDKQASVLEQKMGILEQKMDKQAGILHAEHQTLRAELQTVQSHLERTIEKNHSEVMAKFVDLDNRVSRLEAQH